MQTAVQAPLKGEWCAIISPADKVPSHGTTHWAMSYAFDFIQLQSNQHGHHRWHNKSIVNYLLAGVRLDDAYSWGKPVFSPFDGRVVALNKDMAERQRLHLVSDVGRALLNDVFFSYTKGEVSHLAGNYLIIEGADYCALLAHLKTGSVLPEIGTWVRAGEQVAEVGHSGNSSAPHLHFQLMDQPDVKQAKGLPCQFLRYEMFHQGRWQEVLNGVPSRADRIRF